LAIQEGRADDIAPLCQAGDAQSKSAVDDFRDVTAAIAILRKSVTAKFGAPMADVVLPEMAAPEDSEQMKEIITGDKAVLESLTMGDAFLVRVDGQWKMDIAALLASGNLPENTHGYFSALAKAIRATASDIDKGRLDSGMSALEALHARQEGIKEDAPATEPAAGGDSSATTRAVAPGPKSTR